MTVLTLEKAAGTPGRLAPYRHLPRVAEGHRVPGCTGYCVQDDVCASEMADLPVAEGGHLVAELYAEQGEQPKVVVFAFNAAADATLLRTSDPAELRRKADEFHRFANRLDHAAHVLDQIQQQEAK